MRHMCGIQNPTRFCIEPENIGISGSSYTNTMMVDLGETLYFAKGSDKNIKITTAEDLDLFKAMLMTKRSSWLK